MFVSISIQFAKLLLLSLNCLTTGDTLLHCLRSIRFCACISAWIAWLMGRGAINDNFEIHSRIVFHIQSYYVVELERNPLRPNSSNIEIICENNRSWVLAVCVNLFYLKPVIKWRRMGTSFNFTHSIKSTKTKFHFNASIYHFLMDYSAIIPIRNVQGRANLDGVRYGYSPLRLNQYKI